MARNGNFHIVAHEHEHTQLDGTRYHAYVLPVPMADAWDAIAETHQRAFRVTIYTPDIPGTSRFTPLGLFWTNCDWGVVDIIDQITWHYGRGEHMRGADHYGQVYKVVTDPLYV